MEGEFESCGITRDVAESGMPRCLEPVIWPTCVYTCTCR